MNRLLLLMVSIIFLTVIIFLYTPINGTKTLKKDSKYRFHKVQHNFNLEGEEYPILKVNVARDMILLFENFTKFLDSNNITYWLTCGNLLGAVRHNGLIPWDDDIDINVPLEHIDKLKSAIKSSQFSYYKAGGGYKVFHKTSYPFIDIIVVDKNEGKWKLCYPLNGDKCTYKKSEQWPQECFDDKDVFPLEKIKFEHFEVNAPHNYMHLIEKMYGKDALTSGYFKKYITINNHKFGHILYMLNIVKG